MKLTKSSAAEVAANLSSEARKLLVDMWVNKKSVKFGGKQFNATLELMAVGIIRAARNLIDGKYLCVLERGGHYVVDHFRKEALRNQQE